MTQTASTATAIITGGRGLIGGAIADITRTFCRTLTAGRSKQCDLHVDLMHQIPDFSQAAGGYWVHAAGVTDEECASNPAAALARAALTTPEMIAAAISSGVEKFVYVSSAHVYGPLEGTICETSPVNPLTLYAQCHFLAEQAFQQCARRYQKPVLILRPCAVYGMPPSLETFRRWSLIPFEFARDAVSKNQISIRSSGLQSRNFVSSRWIANKVGDFLQTNPGTIIKTVNPVGADDITVREFATRCCRQYSKLTGKHCNVSWSDTASSAAAAKFEYRSIYPDAVAPASDLDDYLHEILMRLEQHAHAK